MPINLYCNRGIKRNVLIKHLDIYHCPPFENQDLFTKIIGVLYTVIKYIGIYLYN